MIEYFLLTALANVILSYYLLNIAEAPNATEYAQKFGALEFYIVSAVIGCAVIPIMIISIIRHLLTRK